MTDPTRGVLYPERLPRFTRVFPAPEAAALVAWYWVPEWELPDGVVSRQPVLGYPAANLVVEPAGVTLWGPTTRATERVLTGTGWAVGALLRPAALMALSATPADLVDTFTTVYEPGLAADVSAALTHGADEASARLGEWLIRRVGPPSVEALLAGEMVDLLLGDSRVARLEDAAARLAVSVRTLQRLTHRAVGLSPAAIIRRRRLQEAAQRVRTEPHIPLAEIAIDAGYADQAHLAADFRAVLGFTASAHRAASGDT
ncbi:helix-turn-helix transcriptional regulator [Microbacterium sp. SORGH_AS_0888]|uniref:helix-turn-helix transcriptional regulator n=1 Tax=Microbacterium sp. SORGH_AS_0888 TaxID=3041791 RepID=UPI00278A9898|nr:helix-turn-helix transcriptional regulator [Microbacterium sp. SORGH_AS_0888]MDQ1128081.1 AraC-like DNA-binding protein [Microbacterium sp. SORGH_AS_0888]